MTEQQNYLCAASRIAAGICAAKPNMGFPPSSADRINDIVAQMACDITDRLVDHIAARFERYTIAPETPGAICTSCGAPATCHGVYEGQAGYGCDTCCGHGDEDGWCKPIGAAS